VLADSLQDELLSIPGIAGAELEGSDDHPMGVRVQLATGADPGQVGEAVQRVLASHGMRSQMAHEEPESFLPAGSVVNLSDYENQAIEEAAAVVSEDEAAGDAEPAEQDHDNVDADIEVMSGPPPVLEVPAVEVDAVAPVPTDDEGAADQDGPEVVADDAAGASLAAEGPKEQPDDVAPDAIAGVGVDEDGTHVHVTVRSSNGRNAARSVPATSHGLDDAAAHATVELAAPDTMPRVIAIVDGSIEGAAVVTVMLEGVAGRRFAGSAVVQGSRAYAVARATWAALRA